MSGSLSMKIGLAKGEWAEIPELALALMGRPGAINPDVPVEMTTSDYSVLVLVQSDCGLETG